jgi:uncharacterized protein DUF6152
MKLWLACLLATTGLLIVPEAIFSHHGTNISYEQTKPPIDIVGTVKEFRWANPHVYITLDVKENNGEIVQWSIEGDSPYNWARRGGWNKNTLKIGEQITVSLYPSKVPGTRVGVIAKAILPNGTEVLRFRPDEPESTR